MYEYRVEQVYLARLQEFLTRWAKDGWRLVTYTDLTAILERRL